MDWSINQLKNGCILAGIAHSIMVSHYPELSNEHSWDGCSYSTQDNCGTRGTVTFQDGICVAAFRDECSERAAKTIREYEQYLQNATDKIIRLAQQETLQYLLDEFNGKVAPLVTAAFWGIDGDLYAMEDSKLVMKHGGHILKRQLKDFETAVTEWAAYYDMTREQEKLLRFLYEQKMQRNSFGEIGIK